MRNLKIFCFIIQTEAHHILAEMSALGHHGDAQVAVEHEVVVGGLREVERNL
jgi:hypothetical protein